ncbi:MAG: trigger factor [Deltaproteobacteria bacterium]|nr:trigger factor [Deltaproteobacteria bacterium]MBK8239045.1 trigger factor [Deltaproteobacteria bacterium]MBP7285837.1 trigger factor [Nannocystaceae bacterium]
MQSSVERISPVECRVKVEIPWADIATRLQDKLRDLGRRARVPGFRPGKVPQPVLERMFGKSVRQELARDLVQETFQTAVTQNSIVPLTQPVLESSSLESGAPFTYAARFEVPPAIEPKNYTGVAVRRRPAVVDEAKVTAELERRREQLTELRPLPEPAEGETPRKTTAAGDVWTVDVEGNIGDTRVTRKDVRVDIVEEGAEPKNEFIPGLAAAMANLEVGDVGQLRTVRFVPTAERMRPELRGKEAVLGLGLREVRVKHVPALDDDFARDTGEAESLDELRTKISDKIRQDDADEAERDARRRLVVSLLETNPFDAAPSMIAREVSAQVDATKRQLAQQGLKLANVGTTESDLARRIRPQALFNVKAYLLLDAIGKAESLDVSDDEFEAELTKMAEESGQNLPRMRAQMEKNGQLVLVRAQMREEKILDFLMSKSEVTEAPDPEPEPGEGDDDSSIG